MRKPRVFIADDQPVLVAGLRVILETETELLDAPTPADASLSQAVAELAPDVVVVDVSTHRRVRIEEIRRLKESHPKVGVVAFTEDKSADAAEEALRAGADGYLTKGCSAVELVTAIREVADGRMYMTPVVAKGVIDLLIAAPKSTTGKGELTSRQRQVLQLIAEGYSTKRIAEALNIAPKTAESHRYSLMKALGLHTTADLTRYAIRHGVVSAD